MTYYVSYDLRKPGRDYSTLIANLERLGALKVLYSDWLLNSSSTAEQIRDYLAQFVDGNDGLFVVRLTGEAAWRGAIPSHEAIKQLFAA